jgi:hypothetical protein
LNISIKLTSVVNSCRKYYRLSEQGVSLLEFALVLPLLLFFIVGAVYFSIRMRYTGAATAATKYAALSASDYTKDVSAPGIGCPVDELTPLAYAEAQCPTPPPLAGGLYPLAYPVGSTSAQIARIATCNYLWENKYSVENWKPKAEVEYASKVVNGTPRYIPIVKVSVQENEGNCLLCFKKAKASSVFALEGCRPI